LDLVEETRAMARRTALQAEFQARRVRVPDEYYKHSGFENWLENGILPTKDLLEEVQKPKRVTLAEVLESRLLMNVHAKICHTQVLSKMARKLKAKTCPEQPGSEEHGIEIENPSKQWKLINNPNSSLHRQLVEKVGGTECPLVTPGIIRDPKDPCIRSSIGDPPQRRYGLFAKENFPRGTVLIEYGRWIIAPRRRVPGRR
jgi:hypothetical protein